GEDFAIAGNTLVNAEAKIFWNERLDAVEEKVVEFRAGLASNLDGVFESGGSDQGGARACALKQGVSANGGAVEEDEFAAVRSSVFVSGNPAKGFDDGLGWVRRCRENFQHAEASAVLPYAVGESSSGVDGDAERLGAAGHAPEKSTTAKSKSSTPNHSRGPALERSSGRSPAANAI